MRSLNQVNLIGNVGSVTVSYSNGGMCICNVSLATNYKQGDDERTEWHNLVMFDKVAENAVKFVTVGSRLFVSGRLKTEKWEDSNGVKRERTKVVVCDMIFLSFGSSSPSAPGLEDAPRDESVDRQIEGGLNEEKRPGRFDSDIPF